MIVTLAALATLGAFLYVLFWWDDPAIRRFEKAMQEAEEVPAPDGDPPRGGR